VVQLRWFCGVVARQLKLSPLLFQPPDTLVRPGDVAVTVFNSLADVPERLTKRRKEGKL